MVVTPLFFCLLVVVFWMRAEIFPLDQMKFVLYLVLSLASLIYFTLSSVTKAGV